jgi:hypothetical protein
MPSAAEAAGQQSQLQTVLDGGIEVLSAKGTITFTLYQKVTFAVDGFVFWVAQPGTMTAVGSLHIATDRQQDEDQTIGANQAIFSSEVEITQFNTIAPNTMWVGSVTFDGQTLQVAFSRRGGYYTQANVWHYSGFCVYPALSAQLVSSANALPVGPIVSNSLPIWLAQNSFATGQTTTTIPAYPSFAVPDNVVPPYIVAHIEPGSTFALSSAPAQLSPGVAIPGGASPFYEFAAEQYCRDEVDLTLYGFTNQLAYQYLWSLLQYSLSDPGAPATFGLANSPVIQDAKRTQSEIAALAQKKTIHLSVNYWQGAANAIAYRYLLSAFIGTVTPSTLNQIYGAGNAVLPAPTTTATGVG